MLYVNGVIFGRAIRVFIFFAAILCDGAGMAAPQTFSLDARFQRCEAFGFDICHTQPSLDSDLSIFSSVREMISSAHASGISSR